jgi:hypothetical protein
MLVTCPDGNYEYRENETAIPCLQGENLVYGVPVTHALEPGSSINLYVPGMWCGNSNERGAHYVDCGGDTGFKMNGEFDRYCALITVREIPPNNDDAHIIDRFQAQPVQRITNNVAPPRSVDIAVTMNNTDFFHNGRCPADPMRVWLGPSGIGYDGNPRSDDSLPPLLIGQ